MNSEEIQNLINLEFPGSSLFVENCSFKSAKISLEINNTHLRPGKTVSGPTIMFLADMAMYAAILTSLGKVFLAVTTNFNINFLKKPEPDKYLIGESKLMKIGKRLVVGEVKILSQGDSEPVAHATCTYSIPPNKNTKKY